MDGGRRKSVTRDINILMFAVIDHLSEHFFLPPMLVPSSSFRHVEISVRQTDCECISVIIIISGQEASSVIILRQRGQFCTLGGWGWVGGARSLSITHRTHARRDG